MSFADDTRVGVLLGTISFYIQVKQPEQQFQFSRAYSALFFPLSIAFIVLVQLNYAIGLRFRKKRE